MSREELIDHPMSIRVRILRVSLRLRGNIARCFYCLLQTVFMWSLAWSGDQKWVSFFRCSEKVVHSTTSEGHVVVNYCEKKSEGIENISVIKAFMGVRQENDLSLA